VIGISRVFRVELPVVRQHLDKTADDLDLAAAEHTIETCQDVGADEVLDRRRVVGERAEHEAAQGGDAQLTRAVLPDPEAGWHPALAFDTALKRDGAQIPSQIVAPGVVDTLKIRGAAAGVVEADKGAAMRAPVLERRDRPVSVACDHHRHLPDNGCPPVARTGNLVFQAEEIPHWPFEHPLLLELHQALVAIHPERHPRKVALPAGKRRRVRQKRIGHNALHRKIRSAHGVTI